jgi:3',5'-cyclic AMP phosphodiesterase CpdA
MGISRFLSGALAVALFGVATPAWAARFAVYGDTRDNEAEHKKLVAAIEAASPDFVIFTGDAVMDGKDAAQWELFSRLTEPLRKSPFYIVQGNHDTGPMFAQHFPMPPAHAQGHEYYAFDALGVHFLAIDSESPSGADSPQYAFVRGDLESHAGKAPIVVFLHKALYSSGHHGCDDGLKTLYEPLFQKSHVLAVFQGHDHDYERTQPQGGVTYFVEGGGGAPLRAFEGTAPAWSAFRLASFGYVVVDVAQGKLDVQAYDDSRTLIDRVSLGTSTSATPSAPSTPSTPSNPTTPTRPNSTTPPSGGGNPGTTPTTPSSTPSPSPSSSAPMPSTSADAWLWGGLAGAALASLLVSSMLIRPKGRTQAL